MTTSKIKEASAAFVLLSSIFQSAAFADGAQPAVQQKPDGPYLAEPFFAHWSAVADLVKAGGVYDGKILEISPEEAKERINHFRNSWALLQPGDCGQASISLPSKVEKSETDKTEVEGRFLVQAKVCNAGDDLNSVYIIPGAQDIFRTFTTAQVADETFEEIEMPKAPANDEVRGYNPNFI